MPRELGARAARRAARARAVLIGRTPARPPVAPPAAARDGGRREPADGRAPRHRRAASISWSRRSSSTASAQLACSPGRARATRPSTASGRRCSPGWAVRSAYLECRGLDWETPDRHRRAVRRVGLEAWRARQDTPAEWRLRIDWRPTIVRGFDAHAGPLAGAARCGVPDLLTAGPFRLRRAAASATPSEFRQPTLREEPPMSAYTHADQRPLGHHRRAGRRHQPGARRAVRHLPARHRRRTSTRPSPPRPTPTRPGARTRRSGAPS